MIDSALLDTLEQQHREVEDLLAQLKEADEADQQRPLVTQLTTALAEHMTTEENEVYPELARLDPEMGEEADVEHGLTRDGLAKLEELIGQPGFGAALAMCEAGISHHVEEEENEAFPKLRKELGLGRGGSSAGSDEPTKAELYEQAKEAGIEGRSQMSKDELAKAVGS